MNLRKPSTWLSVCVVAVSLAAPACSQQEPPAKPRGQEPTKAADGTEVLTEIQQQFRKEGIRFDAKAQTVTIPAVVNEPQDPVEYLLIHKKGKRHEAVFWTKSKPSVLNAALLLLGLEPGKNASYQEKDPPPSLEEIEKGADPLIVTPPEGMQFWMTVRWQTPEQKPVECCVEDLLLDLSTQQPIGECKWVYLGGRMASLYRGEPEEFVADFEGNLVSVCYLAPDNHLATIAHERARDDQNWWTTPKLPAPGTEVEFVFHRIEPPLCIERTKRLAAAKQAKPGDGK